MILYSILYSLPEWAYTIPAKGTVQSYQIKSLHNCRIEKEQVIKEFMTATDTGYDCYLFTSSISLNQFNKLLEHALDPEGNHTVEITIENVQRIHKTIQLEDIND